jgi:hypothetical protein
MSVAILVTRDPERQRLIARIHDDLQKVALHITAQTIEKVIDAYDERRR